MYNISHDPEGPTWIESHESPVGQVNLCFIHFRSLSGSYVGMMSKLLRNDAQLAYYDLVHVGPKFAQSFMERLALTCFNVH